LGIFAGTPPPPGFNNTNMVFIPKPSGDPLETLCARAPGALRPISLANADNKVIAMAFARPLGEVASRWCSGDQFGFIAGRSIWDAVMLFEAAALHLSRRDAEAGLLFIDFRAAFPSILHGWIRRALLATGLPETFVIAFLLLYIDVFAMLCFGSGASSWLAMLSGIRQGCPASGATFRYLHRPAAAEDSVVVTVPVVAAHCICGRHRHRPSGSKGLPRAALQPYR
jgi:hypothetical protein